MLRATVKLAGRWERRGAEMIDAQMPHSCSFFPPTDRTILAPAKATKRRGKGNNRDIIDLTLNDDSDLDVQVALTKRTKLSSPGPPLTSKGGDL